jgi:hypothetical protein
MSPLLKVQGRTVHPEDICLIRQWIQENPSSNRTHLSRELCRRWNWRALSGRYKDMACRSLLLKLEKMGYVTLPPRHSPSKNAFRNRSIPYVAHPTSPIQDHLGALLPLRIETIEKGPAQHLLACLLARYHYLGYCGSVGQNMKYLVSNSSGSPMACLLFGSAAWKMAPRDRFIGWNPSTREHYLPYLSNNMRFLILPWVLVPSLASSILARIAKRISSDWSTKYGHPLYLLETFVDQSRFLGTCYKAANWISVGQTQGRTRNDPSNTLRVSIKDVYLYPLSPAFRELLTRAS